MAEATSPGFKYRAFLSYSHADSRWARWLQRSLETYRLPQHMAGQPDSVISGRPLRPVFRDRADLSSASSLPEAVSEALEHSESLVVICSPSAVRSKWVNEEILTFKRLGRSGRVFCFIVDGEPNSGDETECFPGAVRFDLDEADKLGTAPLEPLAADARSQGDGRITAKLKLIAGLLGVGFDDLRQRDLSRRHRRMLAITTGSLLIAVVTISLAVLAFLSSVEAERRRAQAEDLVGFMLGDLREDLQEIGRLDLYMRVGNKAMEYFAALSDEEVSDDSLSLRSKALRQIGEVRMDQGETGLALESFRESLVITQKLASRDINNADWQIALANSHFYIGYIHWQRDELEKARKQFETVIPIINTLSSRNPDQTEWLVEKGYAYTNLGRVLEQQGQLESAFVTYQEVKNINDTLLELEPENTDYFLEVGFAHNNLGKVAETLGRLQEAEDHYMRDLQIKLKVAEQNPRHNLWQGYLSSSHAFMGKNYLYQGNYPAARQQIVAALTILDRLLSIEPEHTDRLERKAIYLRSLAALDRKKGAFQQAGKHIRTSVDIFTGLREKDESNAVNQSGLAESQLEAARLASLQGDSFGARDLIHSAQAILKLLLDREPSNQNTKTILAISYLVAGDTLAASKDPESATSEWTRALEYVEAVGGSERWQLVDLRAALLIRLGRGAEAYPLTTRLLEMGYQSSFD